jgi:acetyltransferase-like isoleucine patch superfamily enzyme
MNVYNAISKLSFFYFKLKTICYYRLFLKECGFNVLIIKPILITPKYIKLKNNISFRNNCRIEGVSKYQNITYNPLITISDNVNIEQNLHLTCANKITIGMDTSISANVTITDIIHPFNDVNILYKDQPIGVKEVSIGSNCLILNNAVILPGAHIGNGCIIGANSIVKEGIYPDFSLLAGSPAKIIKRYDFTAGQWIKNII